MSKKYSGPKLENGLYYTDGEIMNAYRLSKDKQEQLKILAELNLCSQEDIKQSLIRAGFTLEENGLYCTDNELKDLYIKGTNKRVQLSSLAKMNSCTEDDIKAALLRAGLDGRQLPRKSKKQYDDTQPNDPYGVNHSDKHLHGNIISGPTVSSGTEDLSAVTVAPCIPDNTFGSTLSGTVICDPTVSGGTANITDTTTVPTESDKIADMMLEYIKDSTACYHKTLMARKAELTKQIADEELVITELKKELKKVNRQLLMTSTINQTV